MPSRWTRFLVTPVLSLPAVQVSATEVADGVVAARLLGALGGVVSIVQGCWAGVGSVTPPAVAATENVCAPAASPEYVRGLVHATAAAPSKRQAKVAGVRVEGKAKVPDVELVIALGPLEMLVSGVGTAEAGTATPRTSTPAATAAMVRRRIG